MARRSRSPAAAPSKDPGELIKFITRDGRRVEFTRPVRPAQKVTAKRPFRRGNR